MKQPLSIDPATPLDIHEPEPIRFIVRLRALLSCKWALDTLFDSPVFRHPLDR